MIRDQTLLFMRRETYAAKRPKEDPLLIPWSVGSGVETRGTAARLCGLLVTLVLGQRRTVLVEQGRSSKVSLTHATPRARDAASRGVAHLDLAAVQEASLRGEGLPTAVMNALTAEVLRGAPPSAERDARATDVVSPPVDFTAAMTMESAMNDLLHALTRACALSAKDALEPKRLLPRDENASLSAPWDAAVKSARRYLWGKEAAT